MAATADPFTLYRELTALRHIKRFQQHACIAPISVAEHSFYVALLADVLCRSVPGEVSRADVVEGALWHDVAEAVTGDVPHPVFRLDGASILRKEWERLETVVEQKLAMLGGRTYPPQAAQTPLGADLIKMADSMELVLYCAEEQAAGNHTLDRPMSAILTLMEKASGRWREQYGPDALRWYLGRVADMRRALTHNRHAHGMGFGDFAL